MVLHIIVEYAPFIFLLTENLLFKFILNLNLAPRSVEYTQYMRTLTFLV